MFIQSKNNFIQSRNRFIQSRNIFIQSMSRFIQPRNAFIQSINKFIQSNNGIFIIQLILHEMAFYFDLDFALTGAFGFDDTGIFPHIPPPYVSKYFLF